MGRRKGHKEYAIKLVHPELGDYYYHYNNNGGYYNPCKNNALFSFYFTQNLNKVSTWKTLKFVEKQILEIKNRLDQKNGKILIELGKDAKDELKENAILSRKKYYYPIKSIMSKVHIDNAKNNLDKLNQTLVEDSKLITKLIKSSKHLEKDFMKIFHKLHDDINSYRKDHNFLEMNSNAEPIFLEIVDASYSFRLLKLKTLKKIQNDEILS